MLKIAALTAALAAAEAANVTVDTTFGPVVGDHGLKVDAWRSVPFAAPPVGDLRFAAPQPPAPWTEPVDARATAPLCAQAIEAGLSSAEGQVDGQEDCLYLQVVRPRGTKAGDKLDTLVWIHGGGFVSGAPAGLSGEYDAAHIAAERGVVVVSPAYRLGPFGFLALEELGAEDAADSVGNMGIRDQRLALQWVRDNVEAFGGNPDAVTLWGESAGGFSVCALYANAQSAQSGLFRAAIMESGTCSSGNFFPARADAVALGNVYADAAGCGADATDDVLACLRALPAAAVVPSKAASKSDSWPYEPGHAAPPADALPPLAPVLPWGAVVDGSPEGLPDRPLALMQAGKAEPAPFLAGYNDNEGSPFVMDMPYIVPGGIDIPIDEASVRAAAAHMFNVTDADVDPIIERYSPDARGGGTWTNSMAMIIRDSTFTCPTRAAAAAVVAAGQPAFVYRFNYTNDWIDTRILGDYHGAETPFVFHNPTPLLHRFSDEDDAMADAFGAYWAALAASGAAPGDDWPDFSTGQHQVMDVPVATEEYDDAYGNCELWGTYRVV